MKKSPVLYQFVVVVLIFVFSLSSGFAEEKNDPVSWEELEALVKPPADHVIKYGPDEYQFAELRLPKGEGPFPVVVFVHGGCWLSDFDLSMAANMSNNLASAGIAAWTVEYRRIGNEGGAWPGTMHDMASSVEYLREIADDYDLDLSRVVLMGHSAGGHLALWYVAKSNLDSSSEFYNTNPLKIKGVVPLAAISNISTYRHEYDTEDCNTGVPGLLKAEPEDVPERVVQINPEQLLPLGVPIRMVHGAKDKLVPLRQSTAFLVKSREAGDDITLSVVQNAGHFDVIAPISTAWKIVLRETLTLLGE